MTNGICGDNRFEIIAEVKKRLIEGTNIESHPEELAQVDNILFRLWQLDYLNEDNKCHDLRKNPQDLPKDRRKVLCYISTVLEPQIGFYDKKNDRWYIQNEETLLVPIAWYAVPVLG